MDGHRRRLRHALELVVGHPVDRARRRGRPPPARPARRARRAGPSGRGTGRSGSGRARRRRRGRGRPRRRRAGRGPGAPARSRRRRRRRGRPPSSSTTCHERSSCPREATRVAVRTSSPRARCLATAFIETVPRKRVWPSSPVRPSGPMRPRNQGETTPSSTQPCTVAANSGVWVVTNWAPWSKVASPMRRVAIRPPTPRPLSSTTTSWSSARIRAAVSPAMPAPSTTTLRRLTSAPPRAAWRRRRRPGPTSPRCGSSWSPRGDASTAGSAPEARRPWAGTCSRTVEAWITSRRKSPRRGSRSPTSVAQGGGDDQRGHALDGHERAHHPRRAPLVLGLVGREAVRPDPGEERVVDDLDEPDEPDHRRGGEEVDGRGARWRRSTRPQAGMRPDADLRRAPDSSASLHQNRRFVLRRLRRRAR